MKPILAAWPIAALLLLASGAQAAVEIPAIGQPSPFYGAAGKGVQVEATARPTELTLDDVIEYTLRVRNLDNAAAVQRPDLAALDSFRDFQVEDDPSAEPEPAGERVFRYHLRPRRAAVTEIPGVVFPYYDPRLPQPPDRPDLPFRKARTGPIPVRIRKASPPPLPVVPLDVPQFALEPAGRSAVHVPAWGWWLGALLPPIACLAACLIWYARNPAGVRLARRRRSRAARTAVRKLHALGRHPPADPAAVVAVVVAYLAQRYELSGRFPTPDELARRLRAAGADDSAIAGSVAFLTEADAARFAPLHHVTAEALLADAERLVRRQEGEG